MQFPLSSKSNHPLPWILGLMTGGVLILGLMTYRMIESPSTQVELEKLTVAAKRETLAIEIDASGTVEPIQSVNISPKNPGRLIKLLVEQGMPVKQGQTLAVMDNLEIQAQGVQAQAQFKEAVANFEAVKVRIPGEINQAKARLVQAQGSLQAAKARLQQAKEGIPRQIQQAQEQLRAADANLKLAELRVNRNQVLVQQGAIAQDNFDQILSEYLNAKANREEVFQRFEEAKNTAPPEIGQIQQEILQLEATVAEAQIAFEQRKRTAQAELEQAKAAAEASQAALERVKVQFRDTIITAPFDGVITQKYATPGAFVTPTTSASSTVSATSTSILAIARGLEIVAKVPEVDIAQLKPGQPVKVIADAYPDEVFQGQVIRIAPEAIIEQNVTSFEVTIGLVTGKEKLRSKMNVDVTFLGNRLSDALVVPTVAIVTQEGQTGVMVPDTDNKPEFKPVTVGLVLEDKTQVVSGLNAGERVFIDLPEEKAKKEEEE